MSVVSIVHKQMLLIYVVRMVFSLQVASFSFVLFSGLLMFASCFHCPRVLIWVTAYLNDVVWLIWYSLSVTALLIVYTFFLGSTQIQDIQQESHAFWVYINTNNFLCPIIVPLLCMHVLCRKCKTGEFFLLFKR